MRNLYLFKAMLAISILLALTTCSKLEKTVINQAPEMPSDPYPADGAVMENLAFELLWICSDPDGDPVTYEIYLDTVMTPAIYDSLIDTTAYAPARLYYNATHYWRVVARDSAGNETAGPVWSFSVGDDITPPMVTVTSPNGGELFYIGTNNDITWEASDDDSVTSHRIDYSPDNGDTWVEIEDWTNGNPLIYDMEVWDIPEAPASTRYLVRISCQDVAGNIGSDVSDEVFTIWPEGGMIAFSTDRDGNYEIYTMWADGTHQRNITNSASFDYLPSWSPDCSKIAFYSNRSGTYQIYIMNSDGSDTVNISNNGYDDSYPAWSPNGDKIAYATTRTGNYEIYLMNTDGSDVLNLTNHAANDWGASWSQGALRIAFHSYRDGNYEIYKMNADGGNPTRLTIQAYDDAYPAWSPNSSLITFSSWRTGNAEVFVMSDDGSGQQNLTNNGAQDLLSQWSPDGTKIIFESSRDGNYEIYVMNADGTNPARLTNASSFEGYPTWSPID